MTEVLYKKGLEEYQLKTVIGQNLFFIIYFGLGTIEMWSLKIMGIPIVSILYVLFLIVMLIFVLRKHLCTNCYYYGKRCSTGWGKLSAAMFEKNSGNYELGVKLAGITWGLAIIVSVIGIIVILILNFEFNLSAILILFITLTPSNFMMHKRSCVRCNRCVWGSGLRSHPNCALGTTSHTRKTLALIKKKMNKIIFTSTVLMFSIAGKTRATNYYVSSTGNNSNSGLSELTAWRTIAYAVSSSSPVMAGDTIFIKAGIYANENIVIEKNGTEDAPIVIEGYQVTTGDNPNLNYSFGDDLDESVMPLLDGLDRSTGIAIDINGSKNIIINNIQIRNYEYGIMDHTYTYDLNTKLNNIIIKDIGDTSDTYSGKGIEFYSSNNTINNCIVVNACAQGILVEGDYNTIENSEVYCDDSTSYNAAMDYYIAVYNGNNNIIQNCYVERVGDLPHYGHGIGVKGNCENNSILTCTAKNFRGEAFYVRHRGVINNTFTNCVAVGITEEATGFVVRDGASNNQFNNCVVDNCKRGLMFYDSIEDSGAQYCGKNNIFNNCIITNTEIGIDFNDYELFSDVDSNFFYNCVFYNGRTLINVERNNFDNKMVNCIVSNYQLLKTESNGYSLLFEFKYCDFYNNGFAMPQGTGNISSDPQFIDAINSDFHLTQNSPCIDAGTSNNAPNFDFEGTLRPQGSGFDIGVYEYSETTGLFENDICKLMISPNPTTGDICISSCFLNLDYEIFSIIGTLVKKGKVYSDIIHLSELKPGVYFIKMTGSNHKKIEIVKLIKID